MKCLLVSFEKQKTLLSESGHQMFIVDKFVRPVKIK